MVSVPAGYPGITVFIIYGIVKFHPAFDLLVNGSFDNQEVIILDRVGELAKEVADLSDKDLKSFPGGPVIHE